MSLSKEERELLGIVSSDLQFLRDEWDNDVDDHSLRRSSTVLRRLLVENDLHRAWKVAGFDGQATIRASTLDPILQILPAHRIEFASAGGASFKGAELRGALVMKEQMNDNQARRLSEGPPPERGYRILDYVEDVSVIVRGTPIKRRHIIKYVANKLGGAHLDPHRNVRKEDEIYGLLDDVGDSFMLLEKPAIYFELLSIGQAIAKSEDLLKFSNKVSSLLGSGASA